MNFELSAEQVMLREMLHRFVAERCDRAALRAVVDGGAEWSPELWQAMAELGLTGIGIAEDLGGTGSGMIEIGLVAEAVGRGPAAVPFVQTALAAQIIDRFGTLEHRQRVLPDIASGGKKAAVASFGGTIANGRAVGSVPIAIDGAIADFIVLAAPGEVAVVDLRAASVTLAPLTSIDPLHGAVSIDIADAEACRLDSAAAKWWLDAAAVMTAFEQLGGADRVIETACAYVLERHAFGRAIGSFQAVKHRLVDMHVKAINARAHAYHSAWAIQTDQPNRHLAAAGARVAATDAYRYAARESIQLHGALGTSWEHDAHVHLKHAEMLALQWGGDAVWKEQIVQELETAHA